MIKSFINFIGLIFSQRHLILTMAKREVATQYIGSLLGFIWTFVNPLVMIFVFWFVFSVGFRAQPMQDVPFVVWLTAGLAAWMVFSESVNGATESVVQNAHLVKKTLFKPQILPLVKITSCLITHSIFLLILVGLIVFENLPLSWFFLQSLYYLLCVVILALGIGWAVSALNVFIRDIGKIVALLLQIGFWATPVFWDIKIMSPQIQGYLRYNPMFYVVRGYRDSFISFVPFWTHPEETLCFWAVALVCFVGGAIIFQKLKPQFADVL